MKYKVKEICVINSSNLNKKDNFLYINYLDTSNITEGKIDTIQKLIIGKDKIPSRAKRKVQKNDIVISTVRPNLKHYGIIKNPVDNMIVSTGFAVLTPNPDIVNPEYLYWYLTQQQITDYLASIAETSTTAYPSITPDVIGNIEIELPERNIQDKIAKILSVLDDKIVLNNEINKQLEEIAQSIFKHWFVDFEFPNENGEPYKSSGGKFVESELGMIPEGWTVKSLDQIANYQNGLAMQKYRPLDGEESLPVLKIKELNQGFTDGNSDRCSFQISENVKVYDGDIIFSWSGTLLVKIWLGGDAGLNQHLFKVTSKDYPKWFYYYWTKFYLYKFIRIAADKATTMGHIKRSHLQESLVAVPPQELLKDFNMLFEPIINKIINTGMESRILIQLKNTLLPKLMSGEIRIPEAEEAVESCLQKNS